MQIKFQIKIAELPIEVRCEFPFVLRQCHDYLTNEKNMPQLVVSCAEEEIEKEWKSTGSIFPKGYCESICICRAIAEAMHHFDAFLLHAAVIEFQGSGYAFAAPSGTGKSTHIGLWKQCFGEQVRIINGDKPIIRCMDGGFYAYGTPWCGKEKLGINARTALHGLCFLEQGEKNEIFRAEPREVAHRLLQQVLLPREAEDMILLLELLDHFLKKVPCYIMHCNTQPEAAWTSYKAMRETDKGEHT